MILAFFRTMLFGNWFVMQIVSYKRCAQKPERREKGFGRENYHACRFFALSLSWSRHKFNEKKSSRGAKARWVWGQFINYVKYCSRCDFPQIKSNYGPRFTIPFFYYSSWFTALEWIHNLWMPPFKNIWRKVFITIETNYLANKGRTNTFRVEEITFCRASFRLIILKTFNAAPTDCRNLRRFFFVSQVRGELSGGTLRAFLSWYFLSRKSILSGVTKSRSSCCETKDESWDMAQEILSLVKTLYSLMRGRGFNGGMARGILSTYVHKANLRIMNAKG